MAVIGLRNNLQLNCIVAIVETIRENHACIYDRRDNDFKKGSAKTRAFRQVRWTLMQQQFFVPGKVLISP